MTVKLKRTFILFVVIVFFIGGCIFKESETSSDFYDLVITNGRIIDGTGNPWRHGDVGIRGSCIAAIRDLSKIDAGRRIDAKDKVIAPGFIDMMGTSDWQLLVDSRCASKVTQGITLMVSGEGHSIAPANERTLAERKRFFDRYGIIPDWRSLEDFYHRLEANPPSINFATFVGTGGIRDLVIGRDNRPATGEELLEMERLIAEAMEHGAFGVASALMYVPDRFNSTQELISMARVAASYGGIYITHQRSEGDAIDQSLDEVFRIAREAKIPTQIFHLKTAYIQNWGKMRDVVQRISEARLEGLDITANVYPYIAASANLIALLPPWARKGGIEKIMERMRDQFIRERVKRELEISTPDWENEYFGAGGAKGFVITNVINKELKPLIGKKLSDIALEQGKDPRDVIMDIILEDGGSTAFISFIMNEADVQLALRQSWSTFCTDSGIAAPDGPLSDFLIHPRAYGSYTRILGRYVREEKIMTLEEAIRKASSLAAQSLGIRNRGLLREGFYADIVIFNPETVIDRSTFEQPHQYSMGIDYVLVNGEVVVDKGIITEARPGKVIRGPGYCSSK